MAPLQAELAKKWLPFELLYPDDDDQTLRLIPIPSSSRAPEVALPTQHASPSSASPPQLQPLEDSTAEVNQMGRPCSSLTGGVAC